MDTNRGSGDWEKYEFRDYPSHIAGASIRIVTPSGRLFIHNFFDVDPISPSGRYLACLELQQQDRPPEAEDEAYVCLIDLVERRIRRLTATRGWGMQVGAHLCWGPTDNDLYFDEKEDDRVFAVRIDPLGGTRRQLQGPVYQVTADGRWVYGPDLNFITYSQPGYGPTINPRFNTVPPVGAPRDEGLWRTDTETGERKLVFSIRQAYEMLPDKTAYDGGRLVFFHTKINRQQNRIMQVVRGCFDDDRPYLPYLITMDMDGGDPELALPYEMWLPGSHHPDWHPDGERVLMNINLRQIRFCLFGYDGSHFQILLPHLLGGGHPSISPDASTLMTDAYTREEVVNERGDVPIRMIDLASGVERPLCYLWTFGRESGGIMRCDPHPAWDRTGRRVTFNAAPDGLRQILVADFR